MTPATTMPPGGAPGRRAGVHGDGLAWERGWNDQRQLGRGWTVVLRRRPVRIVRGRAEGGYTDQFEIVCCDCGDDPDLDYREVSPELQRVRGPYPIAAGITAYVKHAGRHPGAGAEPDEPIRRRPRLVNGR